MYLVTKRDVRHDLARSTHGQDFIARAALGLASVWVGAVNEETARGARSMSGCTGLNEALWIKEINTVNVLEQLSSQSGDRTAASNERVAKRALQRPQLLEEIAVGLAMRDRKLIGDCAEVMTLVAARQPELVAPYVATLLALLEHKDTRVRWEAMHSVAEVAALVPDKIAPLVSDLAKKIAQDKSVIVRDYAILALGEYGRTSRKAARKVWPHVQAALTAWDGKHAGVALEALSKLIAADAALKPEVQILARKQIEHPRVKVRTLAKRLLK
ncbi:hypothetical protein TFLX_01255 [Thermoflexales bacterium]|nr:hypothetical protein TFLX_01255 [Thermoflexales bacterium]